MDTSKLIQYATARAERLGAMFGELESGNFKIAPTKSDSDEETKELAQVFDNIEAAFLSSVSTAGEYLDEIRDTLDDISDGSLLNRIERPYPGIFDVIKRATNMIVTLLRKTMQDITQSSKDVSGGVAMMTINHDSVSLGAEKQMELIGELGTELNNVADKSKENAKNAKKASEYAKASKDNVLAVNGDMAKLTESMDKIDTSSKKISKIINTIDHIASQTNLLALNAAVEASRAGEHGRGFLVVAEEVRSLAAQSSEAAKQTSELIQDSIGEIQEGVDRAKDTALSLDKTMQDVEQVSSVIEKIFDSSQQQAKALSEINDSLSQVNEIIHDDSEASKQASLSATELDKQIEKLQERLSFFKVQLSAMPSIRKVWKDATMSVSFLDKLKNLSGTRRSFERGDVIVTEGDQNVDCMYFILSGNVNVYRAHGKTNELHLSSLQSGDLFGEMGPFLKEPRTATIVAEDKVSILEINLEDIHEFLEKHPDIAHTLVETLCRRLRNVLTSIGAF
ncbi:MAG: methyl-accepting chemotaxis protein [Defluviitaleaceae bacterium]|nr:methyl-accepting chemotaxis protein [Defluviitaleaceae bacterium]